MPLTEGETQILLKLADNSLAQTKLANEQTLLLQRVATLLEKLDERLTQLDGAREDGWDGIKEHVTAEVKRAQTNVRLQIFLIAVLVAIVEVIDLSVERWLRLLR